MKMRLIAVACVSASSLFMATTALYAQGAMHSVWDGVYTSAQADRGKDLFSANCAKCHGGTLDGNDEIPPLKGAHFMADWETQSLADLVSRIHTTMPMDNPGALSQPNATDVVAYLMQQNGMPAGSAELNDATAVTTRIDSQKPGAN